jgi:hypothetical protein
VREEVGLDVRTSGKFISTSEHICVVLPFVGEIQEAFNEQDGLLRSQDSVLIERALLGRQFRPNRIQVLRM